MNAIAQCFDTSPEALAVQLDCLRKMTPQQRLELALALSAQVRKMAMDAIRRRLPHLEEREMQLRFIEAVYGKELANKIAFQLAENRA
jgi:hypothetical protein